MDDTQDDLLLIDETAAMARKPIRTMRYYRQLGIGPRSFKLGKRVVYRRSDVVAWIEAQSAATGGGS